MANDDEAKGLETGEGSAEGEAIDAEAPGEVTFGGEAFASAEPTEEDLFAEGVDKALDDGHAVERFDGGEGVRFGDHMAEWFNQ